MIGQGIHRVFGRTQPGCRASSKGVHGIRAVCLLQARADLTAVDLRRSNLSLAGRVGFVSFRAGPDTGKPISRTPVILPQRACLNLSFMVEANVALQAEAAAGRR